MSKLSYLKPTYSKTLFRDQFINEKWVSDNGAVIAGTPTFNNGIVLDGVADSVSYPQRSYRGVKTVVIDMTFGTTTEEMMDLDGGTHFLSASTGTVSATGFSSPTIYVDGVVSSTITAAKHRVVVTTATAFDATAIVVGLRAASFADATIHEVKVYKVELTAEGVVDDNDKDTYSEPDAGLALISLPLRTHYDDGTDEVTKNIGSLGGTVELGDGSTSTTFPTQLSPHGMSFDGGDYLKRVTDSDLPQGTASRSVSLLVDTSSITGATSFIGWGGSAATNEFTVYISASNVVSVHRSSGNIAITSSLLPSTGIHSVVVTYDGSDLRAYVDGEQSGSATSDGGNIDTGNGLGMIVGARALGLGEKLTGSVWFPSIYDFVLTPQQVRYLHFRMLNEKNV